MSKILIVKSEHFGADRFHAIDTHGVVQCVGSSLNFVVITMVLRSPRCRIEYEGNVYRVRRGKVVQVPPHWVGKVPGHQTIGARPSKMTGKQRRELKRRSWKTSKPEETAEDRRLATQEDQ